MRDFWDRQAKRFDKAPPTSEEDEAVRRALGHLVSEDSVLEIGCAAGATAQALRPHVRFWYGIDTSEEMIRRAKKHAGDGLRFACRPLEEVEEAGFDAVVAFNVLHFMDLEGGLDGIRKRLRPGGLLLAQTPCLGDAHRAWQLLARGFAGVMRVPHLRALRFADLHKALTDRFEVLEADGTRPGGTWIVAANRQT